MNACAAGLHGSYVIAGTGIPSVRMQQHKTSEQQLRCQTNHTPYNSLSSIYWVMVGPCKGTIEDYTCVP
jgi:hypothetical protein